MTKPATYRGLMVSLFSTALLTGCVWKSDYDALQAQNQQLQAQNQQLQEQLTASQQQNNRLVGAVKYVANSDLLFASGSWEMRPQGQRIIAGFAQKLAPTQQHHLLVSGFTDNAPIGPALQRQGVNSNEELSQKRAEAVMQFLISQGVDPTLVSAHGYGEADPVAPNDTTAGRAKNRRVELSLAS
jgi:chemotaxis protein MotB